MWQYMGMQWLYFLLYIYDVFMWIVINIKVVFSEICNILKGDKQKIASGFLGIANTRF